MSIIHNLLSIPRSRDWSDYPMWNQINYLEKILSLSLFRHTVEEHLGLVRPYSTLLWEDSGCHKWNPWLHLQLNFKQKLALENVENRIAESAGVTCSSEQHTKSFQTITNASLFAMKHCRNLEGICKARKVCLFNLAEILPCSQLNSCFLDRKQPKSGVFER